EQHAPGYDVLPNYPCANCFPGGQDARGYYGQVSVVGGRSVPNGLGVWRATNDYYYAGQWENGRPKGSGTFFDHVGELSGKWIGPGTILGVRTGKFILAGEMQFDGHLMLGVSDTNRDMMMVETVLEDAGEWTPTGASYRVRQFVNGHHYAGQFLGGDPEG